MSVEAVAQLLDIDKYDVIRVCFVNGIKHTTADNHMARYEVLTYLLETGGYDEGMVRERNFLSVKLYSKKKYKDSGGLEVKSIDNYLVD